MDGPATRAANFRGERTRWQSPRRKVVLNVVPLTLRAELVLPRVAWLLSLASLVTAFAYPWLCLATPRGSFSCIIEPAPYWDQRSVEWIGPQLVHYEGIPWTEWPFWLCVAAAATLPALLHRWAVSRMPTPFGWSTSPEPGPGYRTARAQIAIVHPRRLRLRLSCYAGRLGLTLALCMPVLLTLNASRFAFLYHGTASATRSVPEHFAYAAALTLVFLLQAPSVHRLLGEPTLVRAPQTVPGSTGVADLA